ncbi:MAG: autoinducer binding domain-containing protein [Hyphomicrobiaceae bacterium]|nr:autoinducer binding domain-containing protein [Hyphomicrobiaceae bacterium]
MQGQTKPIVVDNCEPAKIEHSLRSGLVDFAAQVGWSKSPIQVLDKLDEVIVKDSPLRVLAARRYGIGIPQRETLRLGENVFIHRSVPEGWWIDYYNMSQKAPSPVITMAKHSLAPVTWTEWLKIIEPIGIDRWAYELGLKYGMRDGLTCSVGGARWVVVYWSRKVLSDRLSPQLRALLFMAASFAAIRLEQIVEPDTLRIGKHPPLTARELSVLRMASNGLRTRKIAELLQLGEETVRSHIKKAQTKLGARDRLHAVAEALRLQLIP